MVLVYVTLRHEALNVARVALRHAQGGHDVPRDRILDRRARSHARFAWFAERADFVAVFENSAEPVCAAMKRGQRWWLWRLDLLARGDARRPSARAGRVPGGNRPRGRVAQTAGWPCPTPGRGS